MAKISQCPECGGQVQATRVTWDYFSFENEKWIEKGFETVEVRYYCENDHSLDELEWNDEELPDVKGTMVNCCRIALTPPALG